VKPRKHGFTLIEMVVVITITGILAAAVAVFIRRPVEAYVDVARRGELSDIADTALREIYFRIATARPSDEQAAGNGKAGSSVAQSTGAAVDLGAIFADVFGDDAGRSAPPPSGVLEDRAERFAREAAALAGAGGGFVASDVASITVRLRTLLTDGETAGRAAREWMASERGGAERNAALLVELLHGVTDAAPR